MTTLTRRRDHSSRHYEAWRVYYGDVRIGSIASTSARKVPMVGDGPAASIPAWNRRTTMVQRQHLNSRAAFEQCWQQVLPKLTQAQFDKCVSVAIPRLGNMLGGMLA
jgi:hypothetical protein